MDSFSDKQKKTSESTASDKFIPVEPKRRRKPKSDFKAQSKTQPKPPIDTQVVKPTDSDYQGTDAIGLKDQQTADYEKRSRLSNKDKVDWRVKGLSDAALKFKSENAPDPMGVTPEPTAQAKKKYQHKIRSKIERLPQTQRPAHLDALLTTFKPTATTDLPPTDKLDDFLKKQKTIQANTLDPDTGSELGEAFGSLSLKDVSEKAKNQSALQEEMLDKKRVLSKISRNKQSDKKSYFTDKKNKIAVKQSVQQDLLEESEERTEKQKQIDLKAYQLKISSYISPGRERKEETDTESELSEHDVSFEDACEDASEASPEETPLEMQSNFPDGIDLEETAEKLKAQRAADYDKKAQYKKRDQNKLLRKNALNSLSHSSDPEQAKKAIKKIKFAAQAVTYEAPILHGNRLKDKDTLEFSRAVDKKFNHTQEYNAKAKGREVEKDYLKFDSVEFEQGFQTKVASASHSRPRNRFRFPTLQERMRSDASVSQKNDIEATENFQANMHSASKSLTCSSKLQRLNGVKPKTTLEPEAIASLSEVEMPNTLLTTPSQPGSEPCRKTGMNYAFNLHRNSASKTQKNKGGLQSNQAKLASSKQSARFSQENYSNQANQNDLQTKIDSKTKRRVYYR